MAVNEEATTTLEPSDVNEVDYDDPDEPVYPDDDDMEPAEVLVFRPLFSYRRIQAERRRKARRYQNRRYAPYWYWSELHMD